MAIELPSNVYVNQPAGHTSDRYVFVPTYEVLDALAEEGWNPVRTRAVNSRDANPYGRHEIVLQHSDFADTSRMKVGDVRPEAILGNAHNGLRSYTLDAGLYRKICGNGMVIPEATFGALKIRHQNTVVEDVIKASREILANFGSLVSSISGWRELELEKVDQIDFAVRAAALRWDNYNAEEHKSMTDDILHVRREQDEGDDLWRNFNKVQENILRGGWKNPVTKRMVKPVTSIEASNKLNKDLWILAESYANM